MPELAGLDKRSLHAPWEAGPLDLAQAGVVLDDTYPAPIVDHAEARQRCLDTSRPRSTAHDDHEDGASRPAGRSSLNECGR